MKKLTVFILLIALLAFSIPSSAEMIVVYYSEAGAAKTGLSVTIDITDVADGSLDIDDGACTELANGWYKYDFSDDATKNYTWLADGGAGLCDPERYIEGNIYLTTAKVNAESDQAIVDYDPPTDTEMLAAHTTTDALINGIDDNVWDDGTRTLTAFDEDDMTLDVDGTQFGLFTAALATSIGNIETDTGTTIIADLLTMKQTAAGAYDRDTDSLEAIRDRGDAAWTTGAGGSPPTTLQNTTIATLASQTSFTLTAGSADDDAYNDCVAVVEDSITSTQKCVGRILGYTGATKTVTLEADPGVFTMAIGDTIDIIAVEKTWAAATKALTDKSNFNLAADQSGVTIGTCTTNTDMRGTDNAALAATALSSATWTAARAGYIDELAAANIPTDLATIEAVVDSILADTGTDGVKVSSLSASAVDLIIDEIIEGTLTMRQIFRILLAKNTGLTEGSGTATIKFRDLADSKYRITGTITDGNRVSVTLDGS